MSLDVGDVAAEHPTCLGDQVERRQRSPCPSASSTLATTQRTPTGLAEDVGEAVLEVRPALLRLLAQEGLVLREARG